MALPEQYREFEELFRDPKGEDALPIHQPWDHRIPLKEGKEPPSQPLRKFSYSRLNKMKAFVEDGLRKGWIRKSKSPAGANLTFADKPGDPDGRPCGDYRELNDMTIMDSFPLPRLDYLQDQLARAVKFTQLDQRNAFHLIRMARGEEWKTAFKTPWGLYEYCVMPFGLKGAPATCQRLNNETLKKYLGQTVICYLDDILVFSREGENHEKHVREVLTELARVSSRLKLSKCRFGVKEANFLGHTIRPGQILVSKAKVEEVRNWKEPTTVKHVQSFLGFANFCRQFIRGYSGLAGPLTNLTKKDTPFEWTTACQTAFDNIKKEFMKEPILHSFDYEKEAILETDASDTAMGGVLLQKGEKKLHPVAYFSRKMSPAEQNYNIYDKELLAIVESLKHWSIYLQGTKYPVKVLTDHMNLTYFKTTKELNRRQSRWAEELASYDITIKHVAGTENARADALSRKPGYEEDKVHEKMAIFKEVGGELVPNHREVATTQTEGLFDQMIREATSRTGLQGFQNTKNGLCYHQGKIWIPEEVLEEFVRQHHALPAHGHQGNRRTLQRIKRNYYAKELAKVVRRVVTTCDTCIRNKASHHAPYGFMGTTKIPEVPWKSISWDFITKLPLSREPTTKIDFDSILVIVERLTKYMIILPYKEASTAEELAYAFLRNVVANHGLPEEIISDRDKLFTSKFWTSLTAMLGVKRKLSTSFHPQTNGGNERLNQIVEAYLRCYVNYQQDNWVQYLPTAQFAYNSSTTETTKVSPFYANFGYELSAYHEPGTTNVDNQMARTQVSQIKALHKELSEELRFIAKRNASYYNAKRSQEPTLKQGDKVYLVRKNIETKRPSNKLDHKKLGPFKIKRVRGPLNYELALPKTVNIHPVFHISLLEPAPPGAPPAPITEIQPINPEAEYEVESILDLRHVRGKDRWLVKWKGYPDSENSWEPKENLRCPAKLANFLARRRGHPRRSDQKGTRQRDRRLRREIPLSRQNQYPNPQD